MTVKQFVSDSLVGVAIGLVVAMVVLILTSCSPYCYSVGQVDKDTITQRAATPAECPTGGTVVIINGSISPANIICNGVVGPQGPTGDQGDPGQDLTPISFVQLCPGATTYPNVFVEIAMCVDNKLYAVYSIPGSFLTYLPPGAYTSNAVGSACNLVVGPNCEVSH